MDRQQLIAPEPPARDPVVAAGIAAAAGRPRRRVAVVVQRYGEGLAGGAEWHAAAFVKAVGACHELTVLTSCAVDATTWAMHYAPGSSIEGGVQVRRFAHGLRNEGGRARVPLAHKWRWWLRAGFDLAGRTRVALPSGSDELDGHLFLRRQGPACDGLVDELRRSDHDVVVFFTALYFTTAEGLPACRAPAPRPW